MRIMVIGAGSIGKRHHQNLLTLNVDSVLCPYREFSRQALEAGQFDAVVIATATQIRLELIEICAELDLPFYVEKPLSHESATLEKILKRAEPVATRSMIGFMMRYHPAFRALAQMDLSDIHSFSFLIGHDVRQWRQNWRFSESYAARPEGGGVLLDLCHELDMALCLFPGAIQTDVHSLGHRTFPGVDFQTRIALALANGNTSALGSVEMDYLSPVSTRRATLRGLNKVIEFDFANSAYSINDGTGPSMLSFPLDRNEMFLAAMRDFLALIRGSAQSDIEHFPRLDLVVQSCKAIAEAHEARRFRGNITRSFE